MTDTAASAATHDPKPDKKFNITVNAPREPKAKHYNLDGDLLVAAAAAEVAADFGYAPGTPTLQSDNGDLLNRDQTLRQAGVKDGDHFELVDVGGGV